MELPLDEPDYCSGESSSSGIGSRRRKRTFFFNVEGSFREGCASPDSVLRPLVNLWYMKITEITVQLSRQILVENLIRWLEGGPVTAGRNYCWTRGSALRSSSVCSLDLNLLVCSLNGKKFCLYISIDRKIDR